MIFCQFVLNGVERRFGFIIQRVKEGVLFYFSCQFRKSIRISFQVVESVVYWAVQTKNSKN